MSMYAIFQQAFQSFKALHKAQKYLGLIAENNTNKQNTAIDADAVLSSWDREEVVPLLHFWTVFAFIHLYDYYVEYLFSWIPFYFIAKGILLALIVAPQTRGATVFFEKFLSPQVNKFMDYLDVNVFPILRQVLLVFLMQLERFIVPPSLEKLRALVLG